MFNTLHVFQGKLGGSISVIPIQYPPNGSKAEKIHLCFWTTTHMIAGDEFSILNAATVDGKIHQWKLIDDQKPSALAVSSFKLLGLHDRFSLEYTGSVETSVGCVTSVCHNSKRY